jgi:hypothetical protein
VAQVPENPLIPILLDHTDLNKPAIFGERNLTGEQKMAKIGIQTVGKYK